MTIHCLTAVYNRQVKTLKSINDIYQQAIKLNHKIIFWIIEAGNSNITKEILKNFPIECIKIIKVPDNTFWTSGMYIGLDLLKKNAKSKDLIILFNNDIRVPKNTLSSMERRIDQNPKSAISPICMSINNRKTVSTGVIVKNWFICLHKSMFINLKKKQLKNLKPIMVDFMTQRFLCAPKKIFDLVGNYNHKILPHYGGDDEFTFRMGKKGVNVILDPSFYVYIDDSDTGLNPIYKNLNFKQRFQSLFSVKSTSHLLTTIKFSFLVAPFYTQPLNAIVMFIKAIMRAFFLKPKK